MDPALAQIGKYRIERELGRGAMGVVYLAFDPVVERRVAIKTIRVDDSSAAGLADFLRREAKSVGRWVSQGWPVALAYVVGFFVMLAVLGWHPDAPH